MKAVTKVMAGVDKKILAIIIVVTTVADTMSNFFVFWLELLFIISLNTF
jgi:hypothetical protein